MLIYFVQYEIRPQPDSDDFTECGGAFANCFVRAESERDALSHVHAYLREIKWIIVNLEDGPFIAEREDYLDEPDWLEAFDEASSEGECYVLHMWSNEAQEDDVIH